MDSSNENLHTGREHSSMLITKPVGWCTKSQQRDRTLIRAETQTRLPTKIPLGKPIFDEEMKEAAVSALQNERYVMGESVYAFEEEFAKYCGVDYAVSTSSGALALQLSLAALGVKPGDEVLTTPFTFVATANAAIQVGATPRFVDVEPNGFTLDSSLIGRSLSRSTRAVIPVHLFGSFGDFEGCLDVARGKGLVVVEDACQAHGAVLRARKAGSIGDAGCFSFYPSKNMTVCGDGGMVVTNNEKTGRMISMLRDSGRVSKYVHEYIGYTGRLNTVNAAIGRVQLRRLDGWNELRTEHAGTYRKLLSGVDGVLLPPEPKNYEAPVYHMFVIRTNERDGLQRSLAGNGVECGVHYPVPVHLQPAYRNLHSYQEGSFPRAEKLCREVLSLPMHPFLTEEDICYISELVIKYFE